MSEWDLIQRQITTLYSDVSVIAKRCQTAQPIDVSAIDAAERRIKDIETKYASLVSQIPSLREHLDQTYQSLDDLKNTMRADKQLSKEEISLLTQRIRSVLEATFPDTGAEIANVEERDHFLEEIALAYAARGNWIEAERSAHSMSGYGDYQSKAGKYCGRVLEGIYDKLFLQLRETGPNDMDECEFLYDLAMVIRLHKRGGRSERDTDESMLTIIKLMPLFIKHGALEIAEDCNRTISSYDRDLAEENTKLIESKKKEA